MHRLLAIYAQPDVQVWPLLVMYVFGTSVHAALHGGGAAGGGSVGGGDGPQPGAKVTRPPHCELTRPLHTRLPCEGKDGVKLEGLTRL